MRSIGLLFCALLCASPAAAATCGGDFNAFLSGMARDAAGAGISRPVIDSAFAGLTPDPGVLAFDRRQRGTFRKSFEEYAATRVIPARIKRAKALMQRHAALLARVERQFGVPSTLLMAIWTLESDNGTGDMGRMPVIRDRIASVPQGRWVTTTNTSAVRAEVDGFVGARPGRRCEVDGWSVRSALHLPGSRTR